MKLVKYSTTWCGPCKRFDPIIDRSQGELEAEGVHLEVERIDITDDNPLDIKSVPYSELFNDAGEKVASHSGIMAGSQFKQWVKDHQKK